MTDLAKRRLSGASKRQSVKTCASVKLGDRFYCIEIRPYHTGFVSMDGFAFLDLLDAVFYRKLEQFEVCHMYANPTHLYALVMFSLRSK